MPPDYLDPDITAGRLFCGIWNSRRFAHLADVKITPIAVYRVAQLGLAGWTFCGFTANADGAMIELERDDEIAEINAAGDLRLHGSDEEMLRGNVTPLEESIIHKLARITDPNLDWSSKVTLCRQLPQQYDDIVSVESPTRIEIQLNGHVVAAATRPWRRIPNTNCTAWE